MHRNFKGMLGGRIAARLVLIQRVVVVADGILGKGVGDLVLFSCATRKVGRGFLAIFAKMGHIVRFVKVWAPQG